MNRYRFVSAARPTSRSALWRIMSALRKTHMFAANIYFSSFSQRSTREKQRSFPVCIVNIHNKKKGNKTRLYRTKSIYVKRKSVFCCFKFILYRMLVANLFRGSFLGEGLLCNRGFAAKLFFKRYIAVVIGRSPWRRPGIVFGKKRLFRTGRFFGLLSARFFVGFRQRKDRFLSRYTRKSIRQRVLTADKTADAVCAKLLFTAVLC